MSKDLNAFEPRNGWDVYADTGHDVAIEALAERYINFLSICKTERETIAWAAEKLQQAGYTGHKDSDRVFFVCRGKALFAARRGRKPLAEGLRLIAAHADAPRLDFKQRPLLEQAAVGQAKTHYYGGIRKYQWLARPLALHGVVVRQDGSVVRLTLGEEPGEPVFTIADLLPHLAQKEVTKTVAEAFEAEKLNVIVGHRPLIAREGEDKPESPIRSHVLALLKDKYDITEEDLMSAEIQAVPAGPARAVGFDGSLIGGYGQDDRICLFTALEALLGAEEPEYTTAVIFWDKEEIGSEGSTGAQSHFFEDSVRDLRDAWEPETHFRTIMSHTKALSADVHGAIDPDWQELHEKQNAALIGYGPCFCKFTGSRGKYGSNDAHPEYIGWLRGIINKHNIPWQMAELGKVDMGGGGTVALYLAAYGMDVIDCGVALLGMHSPFELASKVDVYAAVKLYTAFFEN